VRRREVGLLRRRRETLFRAFTPAEEGMTRVGAVGAKKKGE